MDYALDQESTRAIALFVESVRRPALFMGVLPVSTIDELAASALVLSDERRAGPGGLADWRTGGLADWRTGGLADWRTGGLADWRPSTTPAASASS